MAISIEVPRTAMAGIIGLAVILGGGGLAAGWLPRAQITVYPRVYERTIEQDIALVSDAEPDFIRFQLPARIVEVPLTEEQTFTRGGDSLRDDFARGEVTLINDLDEEQQLLPRTHLRHEATGTFFLTDSPVAIPPHARVSMSVTAKEKGAAGNVAAGRFVIDKLDPNLQTAVYAESNQDFTGGVAVEAPLTEAEIGEAVQSVRDRLNERAKGELGAQAQGALLRDDLIVVQENSTEVSARPGSNAHSYTVRVTANARAFIANEADLLSLTLLALKSAAAHGDDELLRYAPDSFAIAIERVDFSRGRVQVTGALTGTFAPHIPPSVFRPDNLAGRTQAEVSDYFAEFESIDHVDVTFWPFWVTRVPARQAAVEIRLAELK